MSLFFRCLCGWGWGSPLDVMPRKLDNSVYIHPTLPPHTKWDTQSILCRVKIVWVLTFLFPRLVVFSKSRQPNIAYFLSIARKENSWINTFPKGISTKWNPKNFILGLGSDSISYDDSCYTKHTTTIWQFRYLHHILPVGLFLVRSTYEINNGITYPHK